MLVFAMEPQGQYVISVMTIVIAHQTYLLLLLFNLITTFIDSHPSCVPICPVTVSLQSGNSLHERQQLPLRLAWVLTIHKSQGLTPPKAWIDIGKTEKSPGITYVALSRVQNLSFCVIEPTSFERLSALKSSRNLTFRLQEEERLDYLAQTTAIAFNH